MGQPLDTSLDNIGLNWTSCVYCLSVHVFRGKQRSSCYIVPSYGRSVWRRVTRSHFFSRGTTRRPPVARGEFLLELSLVNPILFECVSRIFFFIFSGSAWLPRGRTSEMKRKKK